MKTSLITTVLVVWVSWLLPPASAPAAEGLLLLDHATRPPTSCARFEVLEESAAGLLVRFHLDALQREDRDVDGGKYTALSLPGGGLVGAVGQPARPTLATLIRVPAGMVARAEVLHRETRTLPDIKLAPVPPQDGIPFLDAACYGPAARTSGEIAVQMGHPAIYLGQPVTSVRVDPVLYDPQHRTVEVATRLDVRIHFEPGARGVQSRRAQGVLPLSHRRQLGRAVLNADRTDKSTANGDDPGTYLVITHPAATGIIAPLVQWRQRQGYNVIVTSTAEIGPTAGNIQAYIQDIYDTVEPRLAYVVLVGDATGSLQVPAFTEGVSGYNGETDHYYTTLDGDDYLSDIHIGRLTAGNATELTNIVQKIVGYEVDPPEGEDGHWFRRASLVGDPASSGMTTIYVNQWLKGQLLNLGFAEVDTIWDGNYPTLMYNSLNQGASVFGYRGFYAVSNFSQGHIMSLGNGGKLPFAVLPTCDSGSFRTIANAHSEAFLRSPGGGAVGAIGLSTLGTHTRYNNCLYNGIWEGALNSGDHHLGAALSRGKLELYNNYDISEPASAQTWTTWANLMGDPATDLWLAVPATFEVQHPASLPSGASTLEVVVLSGGSPVPGARVALTQTGAARSVARTDDDGRVLLEASGAAAGTLQVTVTMHNHRPYLGQVALGPVAQHVQVAAHQFSEDLPADGLFSPAEMVNLSCALTNLGSEMVAGVTARLRSDDPLVSILDDDDSFGDLEPGQTLWGSTGFQVQIDAAAEDGHRLELEVVAQDGDQEWASPLFLEVTAPAFRAQLVDWQGSPGGAWPLVLSLENIGGLGSEAGSATLTTSSPWLLVDDDSGQFAALAPGQSTDCSADPFSLIIDPRCPPGHVASLLVQLNVGQGMVREVPLQLTIGTASSTDPLGPDAYGYIALDDRDTGYRDAPVFDWVEINPHQGGPGTDLGLTDFHYEGDDTEIIDLPFPFTFYGQSFARISVCSNGWIAMGASPMVSFRNWAIPSAGSPDGMIAAFWDNLVQTSVENVYGWHDEAGGRFIIEWFQSRNPQNGDSTFQIILHDPATHPTATGDGKILIQYLEVHNSDAQNGYATVGIQNLSGDDGLGYTYWNNYPAAASHLLDQRAILFLPEPEVLPTTCTISPESWTLEMAPGRIQDLDILIANDGNPDSELPFWVEKVDPFGPDAAGKNMEGSTLFLVEDGYPIGEVVDLQFGVSVASPDNEYLAQVTMDFPPAVKVLGATDLIYSGVQSLAFQGEPGPGAHLEWHEGFITRDHTAYTTISLDFTNMSGNLEIPFTLIGDFFGGEPHEISGTLLVIPAGEEIVILSPNGGETLPEGRSVRVDFLAGGGQVQDLALDLDRNNGNGWERLAENIPAADGRVNWVVTGPLATGCRMRLMDMDDPEIFDLTDGTFTIGRDLTWLSVSPREGRVPGGQSAAIQLRIDTTDLVPGEYAVDAVVFQMATGRTVIPVRLNVLDPSDIPPALPLLTRLEPNHPNPFNPRTTIRFSLEQEGPACLKVFDASGRLVRTLVEGNLPRGRHQAVWRGRDNQQRRVPSGVYFYLLETAAGKDVRKMTLVK